MSDLVSSPLNPASLSQGTLRGLGPLVAIVFFGFLAIGAPLPALALHVHGSLGFSAVVVGWVVGSQSLITIVTRHHAGALSDHRGPRTAVLLGLPLAALAGGLYLASVLLPLGREASLAVLLLGRLVLGLGESLFMTGALSWGIARLGPRRTGKVMAWQGIALYGALGVGAPIGLALQQAWGFAGVAVLVTLAPLVACLIACFLPTTAPGGGGRAAFHEVIGLIWRPGLVLTLATMPFAAMAAFLALDYAARGWPGAGLALSGFGAGYVAVRLLFAHLPDRLGAAPVAAGSLAVETLGQAILWMSQGPAMAFAGALLTGIGFSLMFPSMGVVATLRVAPEMRGRAVGNFTAFFDVAVGFTGPVVGLLVGHFGYAVAFLIGALATLAALALLPGVARLRTRS